MSLFKTSILSLFCLLLISAPPVFCQQRFVDNGNGTVTDHKLKLMWAKYDNQGDIDWKGAERYCQMGPPQILGQYDDWRMPTLDELKSLYFRENDGPGYETDCGQRVKIAGGIILSCGWVWSVEVRSITARVFNFHRGYEYTDRRVHRKHYRALPVRNLTPGE